MLDIAKIGRLAQDSSPQDLHAAWVWQQQFNAFNGQEIITDLAQQPQLWSSFFFMAASDGSAQAAGSLDEVIGTLVAMATHRSAPANRGTYDVPYPANTLYVLAAKQDTTVTQLMALGKQWRAKAVAVHSATQYTGGYPCGDALQLALKGAALSENGEAQQEAVVISYCWSHHTLSRPVASNAKRKAVSGLAANGKHTQLALI
ncbi:hypothetical protein H6F86_10545 [Phormidium sp. FACHB-592]|uniref:Uncharacterized protein n=1 Tax=Stenomitos frigidus AS-A4 TaxID=2933935 RepID=A0ABV0KRE4_9CYAN|nr:hypothetical protein [Phormidium sp. FACHB-592]MBD2074316.1 hypothetical protein [Phormidium sp. FACHB-592]